MSAGEKIVIRKYRDADYDALVDLWNRADLPYKPKGRDRREQIFGQTGSAVAIYLVAEIDNKLVGSAFGSHDSRKGWINRVAVDPEYRRRGLATKMIKELEQRLQDQGIEIFAALVEADNEESMKAFGKLGYGIHRDIFYFTKRMHPEV